VLAGTAAAVADTGIHTLSHLAHVQRAYAAAGAAAVVHSSVAQHDSTGLLCYAADARQMARMHQHAVQQRCCCMHPAASGKGSRAVAVD
jgi:hypothetical protein